MTCSRLEFTGCIGSSHARDYFGSLVGICFTNVGKTMFSVEAIDADGSRIVQMGGGP